MGDAPCGVARIFLWTESPEDALCVDFSEGSLGFYRYIHSLAVQTIFHLQLSATEVISEIAPRMLDTDSFVNRILHASGTEQPPRYENEPPLMD